MSFQNPTKMEYFMDWVVHNILGKGVYVPYVDLIRPNGDEIILDFGCGSGGTSRVFASRMTKGGKVICLDTSKAWIDVAKKNLKNFENVEFYNGTILQEAHRIGKVDMISMHYMLHDIPKNQRYEVIRSLLSVLKDNGELIIKEPTKKTHGMQPSEIKKLMQDNGLTLTYSREKKDPIIGKNFFGRFRKV